MEPLRFDTDDGVSLEGELRRPEGTPRGTAVLCHPHPRHGGSKDHPLLWAIRNELAGRRGLVVLGFNFRGIMGSGGTHGGGQAEVADVAAAVRRVRQETPGPTVVVGWSFGASVALRHALRDDRVAALVLVGLPLGEASTVLAPVPDIGDLSTLDTPVLLVAGDRDRFCPLPAVRSVATYLPRAETMVMPDAGHFFRRREREVAGWIGDFVERVLD